MPLSLAASTDKYIRTMVLVALMLNGIQLIYYIYQIPIALILPLERHPITTPIGRLVLGFCG